MAVLRYWNGSSWQTLPYFGKLKFATASGTGNWIAANIKVAGGSGTTKWDVPITVTDTQTITVGTGTVSSKFVTTTYYGYSSTVGGSFGSITDGTSNVYSGASILDLNWSTATILTWRVNGNVSNSGWTIMDVNGTAFRRDAATNYTSGSGTTQWTWELVSNPFGSTGSTSTVYWY